jgi:2-methylcitrate dehydratase PrpD
MRSVAEPQMTKDACAWGAALGVESALLAARGFTSLRPEYLEADCGDLGSSWRVHELYVKAYPCCRWTQGAIRAALDAAGGRPLPPSEVEAVTIRTFAAAAALARVVPTTTEEAQYSLVWPVATVLARGGFSVADALGPWDAPELEALAALTEVVVDPDLTDAFPDRRLTAVEVRMRDGEVLSAGPLEARGEPGDADWEAVVRDKVTALVDPERDLAAELPAGSVRGWSERELLAFACRAVYPRSRLTITCLRVVCSSSEKTDRSVPWPESPRPEWGSSVTVRPCSFTHTAPNSRSRVKRIARPTSRVHTDAPRP